MTDQLRKIRSGDVDQLRLLGISRIPRCSGCPRLVALSAAAADGPQPIEILPPAPRQCRDQVCKPLIRRYFRASFPMRTVLRAVRRVESAERSEAGGASPEAVR
jgi:hypothetical protein